jgi:DNA-binding IscR family transcriptional regulator
LADIISAVEDPPSIKKMSDTSPLQDINHELWDSMSAKMTTFTRSVTLKSLIVHQVALGAKIEYAPAAKALTLKRPDILHARPDVPNSVFALGRIG